jgi:His/Glu/Gln/Arg/opine family amino acid ABC transporter permease subunit
MEGYSTNWSVVWQYREILLAALWTTTKLTLYSCVLGAALGVAFAYLSIARSRLVRRTSRAYVAFVRNTPLLLFIFILYLVLPQFGVRALDETWSFVLALSVIAGGYICEDLRAAMISIPKAYRDAALAIGLTGTQRQIYVVMPLVIRYALPSLTNSAISIFKDTSLASVIAVQELTFVAREISTNYFRVLEAWVAVGAIYLAISTLLASLSRLLERRLPRVG